MKKYTFETGYVNGHTWIPFNNNLCWLNCWKECGEIDDFIMTGDNWSKGEHNVGIVETDKDLRHLVLEFLSKIGKSLSGTVHITGEGLAVSSSSIEKVYVESLDKFYTNTDEAVKALIEAYPGKDLSDEVILEVRYVTEKTSEDDDWFFPCRRILPDSINKFYRDSFSKFFREKRKREEANFKESEQIISRLGNLDSRGKYVTCTKYNHIDFQQESIIEINSSNILYVEPIAADSCEPVCLVHFTNECSVIVGVKGLVDSMM